MLWLRVIKPPQGLWLSYHRPSKYIITTLEQLESPKAKKPLEPLVEPL